MRRLGVGAQKGVPARRALRVVLRRLALQLVSCVCRHRGCRILVHPDHRQTVREARRERECVCVCVCVCVCACVHACVLARVYVLYISIYIYIYRQTWIYIIYISLC